MWRRPGFALLGALAALSLLVPAAASAQRDGSPQPKIVGGHDASISQYPWQAAIEDDTGFQFCGGSLLTSRIVITAAHCVFDTDPDCLPAGGVGLCLGEDPGEDGTKHPDRGDLVAVLGRTDLNSNEGVEMPAIGIAYQSNYEPNFRPEVPRFDVGYLVLPAASAQTPIKIAGADERGLWAPGKPADITGWGETESGFPSTLKAATVSIIDDPTCSADYGPSFDVSTMVCAGFQSGGVDTCAGDSGGPLQSPLDGGGYRLVGITSWGEGCAQENAPGVYTRVADTTLSPLIAADVANLESAFGLPSEPVFGSAGGVAGTNRKKAARRPFAKCKRIRNKKKRKRCVKRVKKKLRNQSQTA